MPIKNSINIKWVFTALLFAAVLTILLVLISSIVFYITDVGEGIISTVLFIIPILSVFVASFMMTKNLNEKGLVNGATVAIGYFIVFFAISLIVKNRFGFSPHSVCILFALLASGMLGGILGINASN